MKHKTVCIVGLGYVGLPLAEAFSKHLKVIGFDIDEEKTRNLGNNTNNEENIVFTSDPSKIKQADFVLICVPTPVTKSKEPDLRYVKSAAETVGRNLKRGATVVLESTVYPGVTEEVVAPILERESKMNCGIDFYIVYSPERINPGDEAHDLTKITKIVGIEKILKEEKSDIVLVEGDTNSVLAGALAASKLHIKVGHVEAGLRSYDRNMPEEINRVLADHVSDYLFAPTEKAKKNLLREGIEENKIFVTGNTIVDAVYQNLEIARRKVDILNKLNLSPEEYFLVTAHRQENVDDKERLKGILDGLELVYNDCNFPIIYPIHPRAMKKIKEFGLEVPRGIRVFEPLGFLEFLQLEANAKLVLTDSGGVQEETCILKVPCVTLRDNTERPETLEVGSNVLVGVNQEKILEGVKEMLNEERNWKNPFGDGKSGSRIIKILEGAIA